MQQMHSSPKFFDDLSPRQKKRLNRIEHKHSEHMSITQRKVNLVPMTRNQGKLIEAINRDTQVFILGPAGTGKTYICATMAAKYYMEGKIDKIVFTRPNVPCGREIGFLPGDKNEKMAGWVIPISEVLRKCMGSEAYEIALKKGSIEVVPFETIRGRSFENAMVLLDEAQNCEWEEIKAFVTRIGQNSKVIINGDVEQSDLRGDSGYKKILELARKYQISETSIIEFGIDDVVRSGLVKEWLIAFHHEKV